jgi:hypothetical protein
VVDGFVDGAVSRDGKARDFAEEEGVSKSEHYCDLREVFFCAFSKAYLLGIHPTYYFKQSLLINGGGGTIEKVADVADEEAGPQGVVQEPGAP